jgi:hypothetical protein
MMDVLKNLMNGFLKKDWKILLDRLNITHFAAYFKIKNKIKKIVID